MTFVKWYVSQEGIMGTSPEFVAAYEQYKVDMESTGNIVTSDQEKKFAQILLHEALDPQTGDQDILQDFYNFLDAIFEETIADHAKHKKILEEEL